jgi:hypothetical protein
VTFPPIKADDSTVSVTPVSTAVKGKKARKTGRPKNLLKEAKTTAAGIHKTKKSSSSRKKAGYTEANYFDHDVPRKGNNHLGQHCCLSARHYHVNLHGFPEKDKASLAFLFNVSFMLFFSQCISSPHSSTVGSDLYVTRNDGTYLDDI